jgi:hypothetical protein
MLYHYESFDILKQKIHHLASCDLILQEHVLISIFLPKNQKKQTTHYYKCCIIITIENK